MSGFLTDNGAFLGAAQNIPDTCHYHTTLTGDIGGGIVRAHDTFSVGNQSINLSGSYYNNLVEMGTFNPSPAATEAFGAFMNRMDRLG